MRGTASQKHVARNRRWTPPMRAIEPSAEPQARSGRTCRARDQLVGSTGDVIVSQIGIKRVGGRDFERRFGCDGAVHPDLAGFDQPLCFGATIRDATLHQRDVESDDAPESSFMLRNTHVAAIRRFGIPARSCRRRCVRDPPHPTWRRRPHEDRRRW
mgnify:CR=1 FL=1